MARTTDHDTVDSFRTDYKADGSVDKHRIQGPIGDDSSYDLLGAYAQHETDLTDRLKLFVGGRYTYAQADVGRYEDPVSGEAASYGDDWQNFVANARLLYDLDKAGDFKLFGGVLPRLPCSQLCPTCPASTSRVAANWKRPPPTSIPRSSSTTRSA